MRHILSFILGLLILAGCSGGTDSAKNKKLRPIMEKVRKLDLKDVISNTGILEAIDKVELKSEASGRIDTICVNEGATLRKGEIILRIDPERLETQKEQLKLPLRKAQLQTDISRRDYENSKKLVQFGKISSNALDDTRSKYELDSISTDEIHLQLRDIQKQLDNTVIRAPMNGVLIALDVKIGEIVVSVTGGSNAGTQIGTIANVKKLEVVTDVGEIDYPRVKIGMPAEISMASDPAQITHGKINFISQAAKQQNNSEVSSFKIRISVDSLLMGMVPGVNVNVDFVLME